MYADFRRDESYHHFLLPYPPHHFLRPNPITQLFGDQPLVQLQGLEERSLHSSAIMNKLGLSADFFAESYRITLPVDCIASLR